MARRELRQDRLPLEQGRDGTEACQDRPLHICRTKAPAGRCPWL